METLRRGRRYTLGPFAARAEAQAVLGVLQAKAAQEAGTPGWAAGLGLEPEWLARIEATPWDVLVGELGGVAGAGEAGSDATAQLPEGVQGAAAGQLELQREDGVASADEEEDGPEEAAEQGSGASPRAKLPARRRSFRPAGASGISAVRVHKGVLKLRLDTPWGGLQLGSLPGKEAAARLADWALLWRAMRQAAGAGRVGSDGRPAGGGCLPPPAPDMLPPNLNRPAEAYLDDPLLMDFLGRASLAEVQALLEQEAAAAQLGAEAGMPVGPAPANRDGASHGGQPPAKRGRWEGAAPAALQQLATAQQPVAPQHPGSGAADAQARGWASAAAAAPRSPLAASFEMLYALQPVLEGCGVEPRLLSSLELGFARLAPAVQHCLHRALPRAAHFGGRPAVEQLLQDALQGGC